MAATHAQIAREIVGRASVGAFARAALDVVARQDYTTLERMLPGVKFDSRKVSATEWELIGACADGSVAVWRVGT